MCVYVFVVIERENYKNLVIVFVYTYSRMHNFGHFKVIALYVFGVIYII